LKQRLAVKDLDDVHWSMEDDGHAVWVYMPCRLTWIEPSERVASINNAKHVVICEISFEEGGAVVVDRALFRPQTRAPFRFLAAQYYT
jgi:hypothetical protein